METKKVELKNLLVFDCNTFFNESENKTQVKYEYTLYSSQGDKFPDCIRFKNNITVDNYEQFLRYCLDIVFNYFGTTKENYHTIGWY